MWLEVGVVVTLLGILSALILSVRRVREGIISSTLYKKGFALHMATEHGGLDMIMLLDKRKEVRRFARRIGLGQGQSPLWWQGLRQLDQFRRRHEHLQRILEDVTEDEQPISIQGLSQLLEEVAWSDMNGGVELMVRKEELLTEIDNLIEAHGH